MTAAAAAVGPPSRNALRNRWLRSETALGIAATLGSGFAAEVLAGAGLDYVCVDLQHGLTGFADLSAMLAAVAGTGSSPVVRVPANRFDTIGRALDLGAHGVIVPMVNSAEEAAAAAAACRYAPTGARSYGPIRASLATDGLNGAGAAVRAVDAEVLCLPMIETLTAVERVDEIMSTPGVDGVFVGPSDLALTCGWAPTTDPLTGELGGHITEVAVAAGRHGVRVGIHATGGAQAAEFATRGFDFVTLSTDTSLLRTAVGRIIDEVRPA